MDIQLPLSALRPDVASRITWVHGNLCVLQEQNNQYSNPISLTTRLPFEDEEFDHVRMRHIARGVPENKV
jgi:hypothetical protein